jgi:DNA-binding ferritin-like protein
MRTRQEIETERVEHRSWLTAEANRLEAEAEDCREHLIAATENRDDETARFYTRRLERIEFDLDGKRDALRFV